MEEMGSLWGYQESILELKHKLLCTMFELESAKTEAKEEMRQIDENIKQLLQLLKLAYQERDKARNKLQILMKEVSYLPANVGPVLTHKPPESLPPKATKANSSAIRSDTALKTYNHHLSCSSPVDCYCNAISSLEFSNTSLIDSSNLGAQKQPLVQTSSGMTLIDPVSAVIENLVKGKPLPQKGKLLQAVMEAGPLLQTLLAVGPPLPRWRNPPSPQSLLIPSALHEGSDHHALNQKTEANSNYKISNSSCSYHDVYDGSSQRTSLTEKLACYSSSLLSKELPLSSVIP
ncbi:hypothetical protein F0562_017021 [Nyssa sinensis]|uniref:Uncharacterized protein n=1 Tax=Nyssa sinensis TaxID=561372 RepID=A0A5J4ZCW7_9ASTE|nr:hypothetical protein F0562_017021 [Nyssa sinensis]